MPCHPDALAMAYALKRKGKEVMPLTGMVDPKVLIEGGRNTIVFEGDENLRKKLFEAFSTAHSPKSGIDSLKSLALLLAEARAPAEPRLREPLPRHHHELHGRARLRRPQRKEELRAHRASGRSQADPFDTYNLFYRGELEERVLAPLRREIQA